jgi:tRNA threonylcarbamoyladenosine biosynthesis protein TsaB
MLTLAFDTSSKTASVAILRDEAVIYDAVMNTGRNHSEVLLPAIDEACTHVGVKISAIDLFACTLGPGSFTGLRIGISTLKGLMIATGKPAVGISTLEALALNAGQTDKTIGAMLDAGRGQVYLAYYQYDQDGSLIQLTAEKAMSPENVKDHNEQDVIYVGDGAIRYADILRGVLSEKNHIVEDEYQYIHASSVGRLGIEKYRSQTLLPLEKCVPVYLRSADAVPSKPLFDTK